MTKKTKRKKSAKKPTKPIVEFDERMPDICTDGDEHAVDPCSFTQADGAAWIVNAKCQKCGRIGSAMVYQDDIQW